MKNTLQFCTGIAFLFILSCTHETDFNQTETLRSRSATGLYQIIGGDGYVVLLKTLSNDQDDIFILFTNTFHQFGVSIDVKSINETANGLEISLKNGNVLRWTVGPDMGATYSGYGLSKVSGNYYHPFFYGVDGPLQDPDVSEVSCKCRANTEKPSCDHGGKGSTECSIEHGGTLVGSGIQMKCAVKCEPGYYACCKNI